MFPAGAKNVGDIDYVAGWYMKAAEYIGDYPVRAAFVSTNSICQGAQVANIWYPITQLGFHINFAHDTFRWGNKASDQAHVFCVIVGFSKQDDPVSLFHYSRPDAEPELQYPSRLNPYLADAKDVLVWDRSTPLSDVPKIGIGNKPIDGGNYLFTPQEKEEFIRAEPYAERFFHPWIGSREFIQGVERWVLWLGEATPEDFRHMPLAKERVQAVRALRTSSKSAPTRKIAHTPTRFLVENFPSGQSIVIPEVSSERRRYIPLGMIDPETFASNLVRLIPNACLFHFGVLQSQFHNAWMRRVGGRLKGDFRYSGGVVYNNFVWPEASEESKELIAQRAQAVLDARAQYPDSTLADLYDPDNDFLYPALTHGHAKLDKAVEQAYGVDFSQLDEAEREQEIVTHLFKLYSKKIEQLEGNSQRSVLTPPAPSPSQPWRTPAAHEHNRVV